MVYESTPDVLLQVAGEVSFLWTSLAGFEAESLTETAMLLSHKPHKRMRQLGFTMVELLAAVVVFNLLLAGLVKLIVGQVGVVEGLESWAEDEPVLIVRQDSDAISRALGIPATLVASRQDFPRKRDHDEDHARYEVEVLQVERQVGDESITALFLQKKREDAEEDEDADGKDEDEGAKSKRKKRGKK